MWRSPGGLFLALIGPVVAHCSYEPDLASESVDAAMVDGSPFDGQGDTSAPIVADAKCTPADVGGAHPEHRPLPQLPYGGGALLDHVQLVTVTFQGDPRSAALAEFGRDVANSAWWNAVRDGYCPGPVPGPCVGLGEAATAVVFPFPPAASYLDSASGAPSSLRELVQAQLESGVLPPPGDDSLYLLYVPSQTKVVLTTAGQELVSCLDFGGYHQHLMYHGQQVAFSVVADCGGKLDNSLDSLQHAQLVAGHEIIEAATNPFAPLPVAVPGAVESKPGYQLDGHAPGHLAWMQAWGGNEATDLCRDQLNLGRDRVVENSYVLPRSWSNVAAAAGHDPCVPAPSNLPYFNLAPSAETFQLAVGQTVGFEAVAFADQCVAGGWRVSARQARPAGSRAGAELVAVTVNGQAEALVQRGDRVAVTLKLVGDPGPSRFGVSVLLVSRSLDGQLQHEWPVFVYTPAEAKYLP